MATVKSREMTKDVESRKYDERKPRKTTLLKTEGMGMRRRIQKGIKGKGSSKIRLLLVDIELRKSSYKEGQLEDRMKGNGENERQLIISSSLYKSIPDPQSLWS